jgi:hypothetical protein
MESNVSGAKEPWVRMAWLDVRKYPDTEPGT